MAKEKEQYWIFTFGHGQKHFPGYAKIYGTYGSARTEMVRRFGDKWAFQYPWEDYDKVCKPWNLKEVK